MNMEQMKNRVKEIIQNSYLFNEDGGYEITMDYQERELSTHLLKEIMNDDYPEEAFNDKLTEWVINYETYYPLEDNITDDFSDEEKEFYQEHKDKLDKFIHENCYYYYDIDDFYPIDVNIMVDCGNGNYDYTRDNVLNWDGTYGVSDELKGLISEESSVLWLANQQGKGEELKKACKEMFNNNHDYGNFTDEPRNKDKFINSCIQEYENLCCSMGTLTFLVKMSIKDLFQCLYIQQNIYDEAAKYDPRNNKSNAHIVIGKETMCGLFNPWSGSGSVLEIELDKDVVLPLAYAEFCVDGAEQRGYDVDEVYGLMGSCWKETVKEIVED